MVRKVKAKSPAKLILLGEHFVVHGSSAISMALDLFVHGELVDDGLGVIQLKYLDHVEKYSINRDSNKIISYLKYLLDIFKVDIPPSISIKFDFPASAGLGSSAALATLLVNLIHKWMYGLDADKRTLYKYGNEFEKMIHGTPSGIDLTTVVERGIILFKRESGVIDSISDIDFNGYKLVVIDSGLRRSTGDLVKRVTENLYKLPEDIRGELLSLVDELVSYGWLSLKSNDMEGFVKAVNSNHYLLRYIGVYKPRIDELILKLNGLGVHGAKVTGAGGGGCIYALIPSERYKDIDRILKGYGLTFFTPKIYF